MKNINQIFKKDKQLLNNSEVKELIDYCRDLEEKVLETKIQDTYDKEHMLKTMLSDILTSCREYEQNKILEDRYPELYKKIDADDLVKNLMNYIVSMKC